MKQGYNLSPQEIMDKVSKGKPYTLLLLKTGEALPEDETLQKELQMGHLAHLFNLEEEGHISVFGPINEGGELEGIIVFNTTDLEVIKSLMSTDPYVKDGYLKYELFQFFSIPGQRLV